MSRIKSVFQTSIIATAIGMLFPTLVFAQAHDDHGAHGANHAHANVAVDCTTLATPPWDGLPEADRLQLASLQQQYSELATPEAAQAAGFMPVIGDIPGMGVHWVHPERMADPVDVNAPDNLMFTNIDGKDQLVGAAYTFFDVPDTTAPVPFDSELAKWHDHPQFAPEGQTLHMIHVWFVPSSNGPYAGLNFHLPFRTAGVTPPSSCWMDDAADSERIQIVSFALVPPRMFGPDSPQQSAPPRPDRTEMIAALDAAAIADDRDAWMTTADKFIADLTEFERDTVAGMLGILNLNQMSSAERDEAGIAQPHRSN
ncbi:MAG: hypothetical protein GKR91_06025 [Pseudomonadales bacterium]|nr:hypothetical protein [Pseudomonadales bacterium]